MNPTLLGLQKRYDSFISRSNPLSFFVGLGDYVDYAISIPRLDAVINKQFEIRWTEFKKLQQLEKEAKSEMIRARDKLLKIIEKNKIDPNLLNQDVSFIPTSHLGHNKNILEHLKMFESGEVIVSGNYSDTLQRYLFDIAANLLRLGYSKELREFIVEPEEYGAYYDEVNGPDRTMSFGGNTRGNFIFSRTWPKRFAQQRSIEIAREIEPWGAFEALVKFWKIKKELAASKSMNAVLMDVLANKEYHFGAKDAVDIAYAVEDFRALQKNPNINENEIHFLHLEKYRTKTATAHWQLAKSLEEEREIIPKPNVTAQTKALENFIEKSWRREVEVFMKETKEFMEEYKADKLERQNIRQDAVGGKWWKDGERPEYNEKTKKISLGGKECQIPLTAINRIVLCDTVFSSPFGAWVDENDVISKFRGEDKKSRSFYDAIRATNANVEEELGIVEILQYKASKVRINTDIFEKKL